jgi:hypothetical protein
MPGPDDEKRAQARWLASVEGKEALERLERLFPPREFVCPDCGRTSHNLNDAAQRYCGACNKFFDDDEGATR